MAVSKILNSINSYPFQRENSMIAAYPFFSVVYVCDSMEIKGLGHAIFEFISAIAFQRCILKSALLINKHFPLGKKNIS